MSSFVQVPVTTDPAALADTAVAELQAQIPGWVPRDGHLEVFLIQALSRMTAEAAQVYADVPAAIFAAFGTKFLGISPREGARATMTTSWTVATDTGYTIPAGTTVAYRTSGDQAVLFTVVSDTPVPAGATTVGAVTVQAVDVGTAANGIPSGAALEVFDAISYVESCASASLSYGGEDPESDTSFLDRLRTELQLLTPRPILPQDFAVLAGRRTGVGRALGISGYNPTDSTDNNARYVAVALVGEDGANVPSGVLADVQDYLDALREVNFVVKTMQATRTTIDVTYKVAIASGFVAADVLANATSVLEHELSPAVWAGGEESPATWYAGRNTIRLYQVGAVIATVPGVAYVTEVKLNGSAADVVMSGKAPLPTVGTVTGAVA